MRPPATTQQNAIRQLEQGSSLPPTIALRGEMSRLLQYREPDTPFVAHFTRHAATTTLRNCHIAHIAHSRDRALVAIASTDGTIELHEPTQADSHRLTLERPTPQARLSGLAYATGAAEDTLYAAAADTAQILHYDLNTCQSDRPTTRLKFRVAPHHGITDIIALHSPLVAAARQNEVAVFDLRHARDGPVQSAPVRDCAEPVLALQHHLVVVASGDSLRVLDRRKLPAGERRTLSRSMGRQPQDAISCIALPFAQDARLNWVAPPCAAADGLFAFHASDGTAGTVDLLSKTVRVSKEPAPRVRDNADLVAYGAAEAYLSEPCWYIRRRRGDMIRANGGRDWRMIVPNVTSKGVRVVAFGPNLDMQYFTIPATKHLNVTSVHAVDGLQDRMLFGTSNNEVKAFTVVVPSKLDADEPTDQ